MVGERGTVVALDHLTEDGLLALQLSNFLEHHALGLFPAHTHLLPALE